MSMHSMSACSVALLFACAVAAETVMVPMRDGVKLATEVSVPSEGGPTFPVVLVRTVYGRNADGFNGAIMAQGMVAVIQDTRGMGDSEGDVVGFSADGWGELQDGVDTVAWIKEQPWCNGTIGTWGASALGITSILLAAASPDIKAQAIQWAPASHYETFVRGGVPQKMLSERYSKRVNSQTTLQARRSHPTFDAYWEQYDPKSRAALVRAAGVHVGGWFDFYTQGTIDNFTSRQTYGGEGASGNQMLILGPWQHGVTPTVGDLTFPDYEFDSYGVAWRLMNHFLKGEENGVMDEPAVHYYTMGDCDDPESPGNEWRMADEWPPVLAFDTSYYLSRNGGLSLDPPRARNAKLGFTFDPRAPNPSLGGDSAHLPLPVDYQSAANRADVLMFLTEPLKEPIEVTGRVFVQLYVATDATDTDFAVRLLDVYPDGRQIAILDGIQRVKFRNGFAEPDFLQPGTAGLLTVDCWSTSIVFNKGHRIGLHVSSSNWPRFEVNPNTGADLPKYTGEDAEGDLQLDHASLKVAHNAVYMDAERPSVLILPVVPGISLDPFAP